MSSFNIDTFRKLNFEMQNKQLAQWQQDKERAQREHDKCMVELLHNVSPVDAVVYSAWIRKFIKLGGIPTTAYNRPFNDSMVYLAKGNFKFLFPLYGARSVVILVSNGIEYSGELGHSTLIFDNGTAIAGDGAPFIAVYSDT
jgi:hypothetical protein